jgi:uncharacterized protein
MKVHSWISEKCKPSTHVINGGGVIAVHAISKGEVVSVFGGKIFTADECDQLSELDSYFTTHTLSLYPGIYLGSHAPNLRDDSELFNHSCDPNLGILGQIVVVARRDIPKGAELTFDYDTTEIVAEPFDCNCGSPKCRGIVNGSSWQIPEFLDNNADYLSWYISPNSTFNIQHLDTQSEVRSVKEHYTRLHSWLSAKCQVRESALDRRLGVFAQEAIAKHELVAVRGGIVYSLDEIQALGSTFPHVFSQSIQVAEGFYMASSSLTAIDDAERFNHSCEPNVGIKGQILLLARRDIKVGEELVFDYETADDSLEPFECNCGSQSCRKSIDGSEWQSESFQAKHSGWFSWFLQQKITSQ